MLESPNSTPVNVTFGEYTIGCTAGLPSLYGAYRQNAKIVEEFDLGESGGDACCVSVTRGTEWPFLLVAQRYSPGPAGGFYPGVLLVPENDILFVGAGERLLAYDLKQPARLWEDCADVGFWRWARHGDYVVMSAEIEFAVWTVAGDKLWSTFVEPPWNYRVVGHTVHLDVMGACSSLSMQDGRKAPPAIDHDVC